MFNFQLINNILYTLLISYVTYNAPKIIKQLKYFYKIHINKIDIVKREKNKAIESIKSQFFHNQDLITLTSNKTINKMHILKSS